MPTTKVTYVPIDPTDLGTMPWNGINFPANVPVELDRKNPAHGYMVQTRKTIVNPMTGQEMFEYKDKWMSMIDLAGINRYFRVEGQEPAAKPVKGKAPKTPEEYRAHALAWIQTAEGIDDLARWDDEQSMRDKCGCGDDDIGYLQPFFDAKFKQLQAQDEAA